MFKDIRKHNQLLRSQGIIQSELIRYLQSVDIVKLALICKVANRTIDFNKYNDFVTNKQQVMLYHLEIAVATQNHFYIEYIDDQQPNSQPSTKMDHFKNIMNDNENTCSYLKDMQNFQYTLDKFDILINKFKDIQYPKQPNMKAHTIHKYHKFNLANLYKDQMFQFNPLNKFKALTQVRIGFDGFSCVCNYWGQVDPITNTPQGLGIAVTEKNGTIIEGLFEDGFGQKPYLLTYDDNNAEALFKTSDNRQYKVTFTTNKAQKQKRDGGMVYRHMVRHSNTNYYSNYQRQLNQSIQDEQDLIDKIPLPQQTREQRQKHFIFEKAYRFKTENHSKKEYKNIDELKEEFQFQSYFIKL